MRPMKNISYEKLSNSQFSYLLDAIFLCDNRYFITYFLIVCIAIRFQVSDYIFSRRKTDFAMQPRYLISSIETVYYYR